MARSGRIEKIAIYGKGGVGKSVIATALSATYAMSGKRVLHVGCDPKHDSAIRLIDGQRAVRTVLDVLGDNPDAASTKEILNKGRHGIDCCEAGGPSAGLGCGGRGVARTIEHLDEIGILESDEYDIAIFDVLGDVVCGGFAAPLRDGFAEKVIIVVSEEPMALFAANNIARAVVAYQRNGVALAGLVLNQRAKGIDQGPIARFAEKLGTRILVAVDREQAVMDGERIRRTVVEHAPESEASHAIQRLAQTLLEIDASTLPLPKPMTDEDFFDFIRDAGV
jgi:nitrogenase iron protein NifH